MSYLGLYVEGLGVSGSRACRVDGLERKPSGGCGVGLQGDGIAMACEFGATPLCYVQGIWGHWIRGSAPAPPDAED